MGMRFQICKINNRSAVQHCVYILPYGIVPLKHVKRIYPRLSILVKINYNENKEKKNNLLLPKTSGREEGYLQKNKRKLSVSDINVLYHDCSNTCKPSHTYQNSNIMHFKK